MNAKVPDPPALPQADAPARRDLPPAARRALEEAAARRAEPKPADPREFSGRGGPALSRKSASSMIDPTTASDTPINRVVASSAAPMSWGRTP